MRSNILGLRQRKVELARSAKAILAAGGDRDLTSAEEENHRKLLQALQATEAEIVREEARLLAENSGELLPDENAAFSALARGEVPAESPLTKPKARLGRCKYA